ncbi:HD domain-containing protein [Thermosyntropha lipolytica DSM 11003]|uniref:HD domain-containing protein n=1 Tax=Thermosyntropha lipolytica DSM 11003 TaxID=1123382 RepID=A0A1M5LE37_9FIRM|nr:HD domain-containing phosphohydrolase [Thermosyntropha lipolytica]SHG63210.1 HD domain-containing protein [Thermosyntropha lipolytica DSM 11003]
MIKIPVSHLVPGMVLARAIIEPDHHRVLLTAGQVLDEYYIKRIKDKGIPAVYVKDALGIEVPEGAVSGETMQEASRVLSHTFKSLLSTRRLNLKAVRTQVDNIIDELLKNQNLAIGLEDIRDYDSYTYQHSVSVCILSLVIGIRKEYNREKLRNLGIGAILHDIGKITVPQKILNKCGPLDEFEWEIIKKHPWEGFNILRNSGEVSLLSAHVALQHHEHISGSGYPQGLRGDKIHEFARITAVADIFDALVSDRPYRMGYANREALEILYRESGHKISREYLDLLAEHIIPYPVGTLVVLSTGDIAVIAGQNENNFSKPRVKILLDNNRRKYDTIREVDLSRFDTIYIKKALNNDEAVQILTQYALKEILWKENIGY